jgi:hypothetical protein
MMRFRGGGIGHKSTRDATDFFKNDRDPSDLNVLTPVSDSELGNEIEDSELVEEIGNDEMNDLEACSEDSEAEDYGYNLGENSESESDLDELGEELEEEDLGPEGDGGRIDEDMVALGYSEL